MQNTGLPSILYVAPSDTMSFVNANSEQQPDQRDVSSNVSDNNVMDTEVVDVKVESDDELRLHNAGHEMLRGADVQQIDDAERTCNSNTCDQIHGNITSSETHTAEKFRECDVCHRKFKYQRGLLRHKAIYSDIGALDRHKLLRAHRVKSYSCDVCDKTYTKLSYLKSHKRSHSVISVKVEDYDVLPSFISNQFHNASQETFRAADIQQLDDAECICNSNMCDQIPRHSTSHEPHTAEKSYECDVCHKTFKYHSYLVTHKQLHTRVKPHFRKSHECDVCHRTFKHKCVLITHKRTHIEKPYSCDGCNMSFRAAYQLKSHRYVHSDFKWFTCDVCNKTFKVPSSLVAHKCIHSSNKHFICDICGKSFKSVSSLNRHTFTAHH